MEQHHDGGFREKLARATDDLRARSCRELSSEIFRERELEYQKDTRAERFEGPHDALADPVVKTRVDEITKTIHRVEIKEEPSCFGREGSSVHEGSGLHKKSIAICICTCVISIAIAVAALSLYFHHTLELERMRQLERVGSHALCHEEKAALEARLAVLEESLAAAETARLAAEREIGIQTGSILRLHAELSESRAELYRAIQAMEQGSSNNGTYDTNNSGE